MKFIFLSFIVLLLAACNTVSGTLIGVGKDLQAAGEWTTPKEQVPLNKPAALKDEMNK
jgi:predicted small secreted protein